MILNCSAPENFQTLVIKCCSFFSKGNENTKGLGKKGASINTGIGIRKATTLDLGGDPFWSLRGLQKLTLGEWKWAKIPFMILFQAHEDSTPFIVHN